MSSRNTRRHCGFTATHIRRWIGWRVRRGSTVIRSPIRARRRATARTRSWRSEEGRDGDEQGKDSLLSVSTSTSRGGSGEGRSGRLGPTGNELQRSNEANGRIGGRGG